MPFRIRPPQSTLTIFSTDATIFGGIAYALSNAYTSSAILSYGGAVGWQIETQGSLADYYTVLDKDSAPSLRDNCNVSFRDPMADLMTQINEIMFRIAIDAANNPDLNRTRKAANR
jgi:hypothetical protein